MVSKYNKTKWINDSTPVNAENLNKIEEGIYQNYIELNALKEETILVKQEQELLEKELSNLKTETKNTIADVTNKTIGKVVEINYEDLKQKRNEGLLKEGQYYRIIDYITKTANPETRSAEHQFDVIVMATSNNTLSEEAYASIHNGDNYFAKSKLEAWKLWYCLDNDIERFDWADTKNGKGIIYRMIDEFDNDLWYDFKNIQFKRYKITATDYEVNAGMIGQYLGWRDSKNENYNKPYKVSLDYEDYIWCYTFPFYSSDSSNPLVQSRGMYFDTSLYQDVEGDGNVKPIHVRQIHIGQCLQDTPNYRSQQTLNNNVFITSDDTDEWIISNESHHNTIGCWNSKSGTEIGINTAGECFRNNILFGRSCHNHFSSCFEFNTIGNIGANERNCSWNQFKESHCSYNCIGDAFHINEISGYFLYNIIGDNFSYNEVSKAFAYNTLGKNQVRNTYESSVLHNTIGNNHTLNYYSSFFAYNVFGDYIARCKFNNQISYVEIKGTSLENPLQDLCSNNIIWGENEKNKLIIDFSQFTDLNSNIHKELLKDKKERIIICYSEIEEEYLYLKGYYLNSNLDTEWKPFKQIKELLQEIGSVEELTTENKNTIVEAINEVNGKHSYRNSVHINSVYVNDEKRDLILCFNSHKTFDNFNDVIQYISSIDNQYYNLDFKVWDTALDDKLGFVNNVNIDGLTDSETPFMFVYFIPKTTGREVELKLATDTTFEFTNTQIY